MKKLFLVLACVLMPGMAFAQVGDRHLNRATRAVRECITYNGNSSPGADVRDEGVVYSAALNTLGSSTLFTATSTLGALPYASSISYGLTDAVGTNDALACTSLLIEGYDQFGVHVRLTDTTITETYEESTVVFSKLTKLELTGCVQGTDATDYFTVVQGARIGLGRPLWSWKDVESLCLRDASDSNEWKCQAFSDGSAADLESDLRLTVTVGKDKLRDASMDVSAVNFGNTKVAAGDGDEICWRVRVGNSMPR